MWDDVGITKLFPAKLLESQEKKHKKKKYIKDGTMVT